MFWHSWNFLHSIGVFNDETFFKRRITISLEYSSKMPNSLKHDLNIIPKRNLVPITSKKTCYKTKINRCKSFANQAKNRQGKKKHVIPSVSCVHWISSIRWLFLVCGMLMHRRDVPGKEHGQNCYIFNSNSIGSVMETGF